MNAGFLRYLAAKRTVDRRALHPGVASRATAAARRLSERRGPSRAVRVLEVGSGAGGAFPVWLELLAPCPRIEFVATDADSDLLDAGRDAVSRCAVECGLVVAASGTRRVRLEGRNPARRIEVVFRTASVPGEAPAGRFDLLVAQSFWDLLPPGAAIAYARRVLAPDGLFCSTLTFAGETRFEPPHGLDETILTSYHRSMGGDRGGDPRAGDRLVRDFRAAGSGFRVLAEGPSDWRVLPVDDGYPGDERFFLETILGFVAKETGADPAVPGPVRREWLTDRRRQLDEARLAYRARQRDLLTERIG